MDKYQLLDFSLAIAALVVEEVLRDGAVVQNIAVYSDDLGRSRGSDSGYHCNLSNRGCSSEKTG